MGFVAGTLIRMSDNSTKAINSLDITDTIKGYSADGSNVNLAVKSVTKHAAKKIKHFKSVFCTQDQHFLSAFGYRTIDEIGKNGFIFDTNEDPARVNNITTTLDAVTWSITVEAPNTFVAGGWRAKG